MTSPTTCHFENIWRKSKSCATKSRILIYPCPHIWNGKCNLGKQIKNYFFKICLNSPPLPHFIQTRATAMGATALIYGLSDYLLLLFWRYSLIFCRMFIHIMEVCMSTGFRFSSMQLVRKKIQSPTTCHFENIWRKSKSCGHAHLHYVYKH
jgi:hypothetical protein